MRPDGPRTLRLEVTNLSHTYEGRIPGRALDGVTLDVYDHEFVAIVGPVGCGKTTFLRIVGGFITPTSGAVRCDGVPVTAPGPERGYVFQEEAIFPWMTVKENLEFGLLAKGMAAEDRQEIVGRLIKLIHLDGYEDAYPKELSAGMSKLTEMARVLATDPSILLLDEPLGSLDAQTRSQMQDELLGLWETSRKTMILVTHDIEEAIYLADRIVVFSPRPGRIRAEHTVDLPRPRALETRFSPELLELKRIIVRDLGLG
jgi:NitT/TauT family transport system ATP-binding protein